VCWYFKTQLEFGPVTADLTTAVVHSSKLLINDVKPDHSLTQNLHLPYTSYVTTTETEYGVFVPTGYMNYRTVKNKLPKSGM